MRSPRERVVVTFAKKLSELIAELHECRLLGTGDPVITSVAYDSRDVRAGGLFVAMHGLKTDGTNFIADAIARGAVAVACEKLPPAPLSVPVIEVSHARKALAELSWAFFNHPERNLTIVGVTGTNGKTTTAGILQYVLNCVHMKSGLVGTLGTSYGGAPEEGARTTPESADLARHFAEMVMRGLTYAVMEVTSIGVDLERSWQIPFKVLIFTNLTRDHLDYHGSMEAYRDAKLRLFREQAPDGIALINADDPATEHFIAAARGTVKTYGLDSNADYRARDIRLLSTGTSFQIITPRRQFDVAAPPIGRFNVYNLLAVVAASDLLGIAPSEIQNALRTAPAVRGRAEVVPSAAPFTVIVDYAHTPDALQQILSALRALSPHRIIAVVGAGGDRDRGKRPQMAQVTVENSDVLILTSDNPRSEDPEAILNDMSAALQTGTYLRMVDRRQAIETALRMGQPGDLILIAGKGHETYQEIQGVKHPFDDREIARAWLQRSGFAS